MTTFSKHIGTPSFWIDRAVFVTGATGLVGSALVNALVDLGADVVCLIRDWVPESELVLTGKLDQVRVVRGDVCDQKILERIIGDYEIETIFHLAAQTTVTVANRNPVETLSTNITGTWSLLEAARHSPKVKQIITASSDKAYGHKKKLPYTEDQSLEGKHPYDVSKSCADLISQSYANSFEMPVAITRCGNFYGGGDLNWNRLIPGTIRSVIRGKSPIIRSDGNYIRDYIYVGDAVNAYIKLAEKFDAMPELNGEAFNFSNENQVTVLELTNKIIKLMESDLSPVILNEASNEIHCQYLSAKKARNLLGWKPLFTLNEGLKQTIDWYISFFK